LFENRGETALGTASVSPIAKFTPVGVNFAIGYKTKIYGGESPNGAKHD
jgi:hypothetical protein